MNQLDPLFIAQNEARLRYGDNDYAILRQGDFVRCAVTGAAIPLGSLKYWSIELQEAYVSAQVSFERTLQRRRSHVHGD